MRRPFSGWVRLWIVFAVIVWGVTACSALTNVGVPPDPDRSDALVCRDAWARTGSYPDSIFVTECPADPETLAAARRAHDVEVDIYRGRLLGSLIPGAVIPFLVALIFFVVRWIWQGFRPAAPPSLHT